MSEQPIQVKPANALPVQQQNDSLPLKQTSKQGLLAAGSVLGFLLVIILLSKVNDVRHHRLPFLWKGRLKKMVTTSNKHIDTGSKLLDSDPHMAHEHAIKAQSLLESAQGLIGSAPLTTMTGYDIEALENSISELLHNTNKKRAFYNGSRFQRGNNVTQKSVVQQAKVSDNKTP